MQRLKSRITVKGKGGKGGREVRGMGATFN